MPSKKRLQKQLQEEKRQRKYAERDAKMWCDIVLEQEDDLQRKDVIIADLGKDIGNEGSRWESYCAGYKDGKEKAQPKVKAWLNGDPTEIEDKQYKCGNCGKPFVIVDFHFINNEYRLICYNCEPSIHPLFVTKHDGMPNYICLINETVARLEEAQDGN